MKNRHLIPSLLLAFLATPVTAQDLSDVVRMEILPGWDTPDATRMAGLRITLAPGWKTYWRAPGDAGIPPQLSLAGSANIAGAEFHWPVPEVFRQSGLRSIGYHDSLVIPVEITPAKADTPIRMEGTLSIGICEEICVPVHLAFDTLLPAGGGRDSAIMASLLNQPVTAADAGVTSVTCAVTPNANGLQVQAKIAVPGYEADDVVIEAGDPAVWVSEPAVSRIGDTLTATVDMVHSTGQGFALDRSAVRITVIGGGRAIDIQGCSAG